MNFGRVFRKAREERAESQRSFASKLGLTPTSLWKIEYGRVKPNQNTIKRFHEATGIPIAKIYIDAIELQDFE